jgi:thioredoxin-related protein
MIDKNNLSYKLSDIYPKYDFTLIVFYSPECSHCKENVPKNKQMLDYIQAKYPAKKIKIVTVLNDKEQIKWNEFIEKAKIENWLNLKESKPTLEFQARFNTFSNPNYFFINKEGKILLKGFNPKAIEDYLNLK